MADVPLSTEGMAQAEALAERFGGMPISAVLSSPVQRARETAEPIAGALGLGVVVEAGLDEIDFGAWTGCTFEALAKQPEWDLWNRCRSSVGCPGGETMLAAQARAIAAVLRAGEAFHGQQVVLVSHQDVLKAVLAHLLGMPLDYLARFSLDPASRSVLTLFEDGVRVEGINLPV